MRATLTRTGSPRRNLRPWRRFLGLPQTSQKVSQVEDLLVADQVKNIRHRGVVAAARVVLVFPQRLDEVVLALAGQAWNVLFSGIIPGMAEVAMVLLDERPQVRLLAIVL